MQKLLRSQNNNHLGTELMKEMLSRDEHFTFTACGNSMMPLIPHGSKLTISKFIPENTLPCDILLYNREEKICAHRVVRIVDDLKGKKFITRGDSLLS
ncbi:MAG: S24/S26 family peptidase, partial [bacterium]